MGKLDKTDLVYLVGGVALIYLLFFKDKKTKIKVTAEPSPPTTDKNAPTEATSNDATLSSTLLQPNMPVAPSTPVASLVRTSSPSTTPISKAPTPTPTPKAQAS